MPTLIIEHLGSRVAMLNGHAVVGRDIDSDIVINHPTISRTHLLIEKTPEGYIVEDRGSKNGTRINGKPLRERQRLPDGAKLRIGHVRARFFLANGVGSSIPLTEPPEGNSGSGVLFTCTCGVRLWSDTEAIGGMVECKACGAAVQVPGDSEAMDSGATVSGAVFKPMDEAPAETDKKSLCSICQWHLGAADAVTTCPECGLTFHTDCWNDNHGCSAYGCAQVNSYKPKRAANPIDAMQEFIAEHPAEPEVAPNLVESIAKMKVGEEILAPYPWGYVLLAAGIVGSLMGLLLFGAPALIVAIVATVILRRGIAKEQRLPAAGAIVLAILATVAGVAISCMWWLDLTLGGWSL